MGAISVQEFISLDGVAENPAWTFEFGFDPMMGQAIAGIMGASRAILLGRNTYEMFAPVWSKRTADDDPGAPFFNDTDKYVVSDTLSTVDWANSSVLGGYDAAAIRRLKDSVDGDLFVSGSLSLVRAMLDDGLVDKLHLFVYPVVLGTGLRLFTDASANRRLALADSHVYTNGVVHLAYQPAAA